MGILNINLCFTCHNNTHKSILFQYSPHFRFPLVVLVTEIFLVIICLHLLSIQRKLILCHSFPLLNPLSTQILITILILNFLTFFLLPFPFSLPRIYHETLLPQNHQTSPHYKVVRPNFLSRRAGRIGCYLYWSDFYRNRWMVCYLACSCRSRQHLVVIGWRFCSFWGLDQPLDLPSSSFLQKEDTFFSWRFWKYCVRETFELVYREWTFWFER